MNLFKKKDAGISNRISGIKKYAKVGDQVALTFGSNGCLIINISRSFK